MLTSVQKEILQSLINLYRTSDGKSVKGEEIAELMNRNPGTIRNQMQSLRSLGLVKGVPGPRGGYKPTIKVITPSTSKILTKIVSYLYIKERNQLGISRWPK